MDGRKIKGAGFAYMGGEYDIQHKCVIFAL